MRTGEKSGENSIEYYANNWSSELSQTLSEIERETHLKTLSPGMLSGPLTGKFLQMMVRISGAKRILEIGSFTGYSAICMADVLPEDGELLTIESRIEYHEITKKNIKKANLQPKVKSLHGNAIELLPTLEGCFDLIFFDGSKLEYEEYYDQCFPLLNSGGMILADNVLWYKKVVDGKKDSKARALHAFNMKIKEDNRVRNFLLPFADGINCIIKK